MFNTTHLLGIALKKNNDFVVSLDGKVTQNTTDIAFIKDNYVTSDDHTADIYGINENISTLNENVSKNTTDISEVKNNYVNSTTYAADILDINTKIGSLDDTNLNDADKPFIKKDTTTLWDAIEHLSKNKAVIDVTADISEYNNDVLTFIDKSVKDADGQSSFNVYTSSKVDTLVGTAQSSLNETITAVSNRVTTLEEVKTTEDKTIVVDIIYNNESLIYDYSSEALTIDQTLNGYTINVLKENVIKAETSLVAGNKYILSDGSYIAQDTVPDTTIQHIWIKTEDIIENTTNIVYHCV